MSTHDLPNLPSLEVLEAAPRPDLDHLPASARESYERAAAAVVAVLSGQSPTRACKQFKLCRKRLRSILDRITSIASDGEIEGFRACVPWTHYRPRQSEEGSGPDLPREGRPHAFRLLINAYPELQQLVRSFRSPLPPGRPPRSFDRLHSQILRFLKAHDHGHLYPFNSKDKGRRALLRMLRAQRLANLTALGHANTRESEDERQKQNASYAMDAVLRDPFDRAELDAHRVDIESQISVDLPNGGKASQKIHCIWLLVVIDTASRAILGWSLRPGRAYDALDVTRCVAMTLHPWEPREFTVPGLKYAQLAGMPQGVGQSTEGHRPLLLALDNAKAHHAESFMRGFCDYHDGVLHFGRPHQPTSRPIVEAFFGRLESGVLRKLPGGFEPATRLGEKKLRISDFRPDRHPVQMKLLEELMEFIVTSYNAAPHPSLGNLSPLQFMEQWRSNFPAALASRTAEGKELAQQLMTVRLRKTVRGNRSTGKTPSIHYGYVRYSSRELAQAWELIGKSVFVRVDRSDLRQIAIYNDKDQLLGVLTAARPWDVTHHDEQTRKLAYRWIKSFHVDTSEIDCAIEAYTRHLRETAHESMESATQLAFMEQRYATPGPLDGARNKAFRTPELERFPRDGRFHFRTRGLGHE